MAGPVVGDLSGRPAGCLMIERAGDAAESEAWLRVQVARLTGGFDS
jgi:hypothetical protein